MEQLKGVIFDLDSTLIEVDLNFEVFAQKNNIPKDTPVLEYLQDLSCSVEKEKISKSLLKFEENAAANAKAIEGVVDFLKFVKGSKLSSGILTRNSDKAAHLGLTRIPVSFDPIFTRDSISKQKPDPEGIQKICMRWGVLPSQVIMIGDNLFDLEASNRAQSHTIWFNNPNFPHRKYSQYAKAEFKCWRDFLKNFKNTLNRCGLYIENTAQQNLQ